MGHALAAIKTRLPHRALVADGAEMPINVIRIKPRDLVRHHAGIVLVVV
jgi:hypothetical protein